MSQSYDKRIYQDSLSKSLKLRRLLWGVVAVLCFKPTPRWAMDRWRCQLLRMFGAKIGRGCRVAPSCKIWAPWNLEMGDRTAIAEDVDCYTVDKIIIGSNACVSQRTFLCTASHDIGRLNRPLLHKSITIGDHAWICAEAFVGPGIRIDEGAVVAARAVVTKHVDAWDVVAGNPAKVIKQRKIED